MLNIDFILVGVFIYFYRFSKNYIKRHQRRHSGVFIVNFEHSSLFSSASIVDFKQVNVSWDMH